MIPLDKPLSVCPECQRVYFNYIEKCLCGNAHIYLYNPETEPKKEIQEDPETNELFRSFLNSLEVLDLNV